MIAKKREKEITDLIQHAKQMSNNSMPIRIILKDKDELTFAKQYVKGKRGLKKVSFSDRKK